MTKLAGDLLHANESAEDKGEPPATKGKDSLREWPTAIISDICQATGQRDPRSEPDKRFFYVDIAAVDRVHKSIGQYQTLSGAYAPFRARKILRKDDILVSTVRPNLNAVAMVPAHLDDQIASTGFCLLRPNRAVVEPRFLFYHTISQSFVTALTARVRGANYPAVSDADVKRLEIPLPPIFEQRRIVELLDQAHRIRRLRAQADTTAARVLPALFTKLFGDPVTNPMKWPRQPLGEMGELDRGRSRHRPRNDPTLLGGPYPVIQTGDVAHSGGRIGEYSQTYSEAGLAQSKLWPSGTLCITIAANIAMTGVLEFDACFPDSVVGFVPKHGVETEYVQFLLARMRVILEQSAPKLAQSNINLRVLRSLDVPVPPIELQQLFASYVRHHYRCRPKQSSTQARLDRLFDTMTTQAFSGNLTMSWRNRTNDLSSERRFTRVPIVS